MFSRIIDMQPCDSKLRKEGIKQTKSFSKEKGTSKKPRLAKKLQEGSLKALKELLSQQKTEQMQSMSAAGPFNERIQQMASIEAKAIASIEQSAQVSQLFEKLVDTLIQIKQDGIAETTFFLDSDAFSGSIFKGAQITISEYSTAPKIFNIQFSANPATLAFFETHAAGLVTALREGNFGFGVNRLDTSLLTEDEKHAHQRVERDGEKEKE